MRMDCEAEVWRWANNNFEELTIASRIDTEMLHKSHDPGERKAYEVKRACSEAAISIAARCATGDEEIKMPWETLISEQLYDRRPAWINGSMPTSIELYLRFVCLRRTPVSFYKDESPNDWIKRLGDKS